MFIKKTLLFLFIGSLIFNLCDCALSKEEIAIRNKLRIPLEAQNVLIIGQSSHMDWDWLKTYPGYYYANVEGILSHAYDLVNKNYNKTTPYYYAVAEVAFYEKFIQENHELLPNLQRMSDKYKSIGGGITTPDNLLPHGEAFIRNYLVGKEVLTSYNLPMSLICWIPDDFGHDPQLPVVTKAMGLTSISFSRAPGGHNEKSAPIDGSPTIATQLRKNGTDFFWKASDGSKVFTHYMQQHYNQGDHIDRVEKQRGMECDKRILSHGRSIEAAIKKILSEELEYKRSPYMYVPISDDFFEPKTCLLEYINFWNNLTSSDPNRSYLVSASFDEFVDLVMSYHDFHLKDGVEKIRTTDLRAIPYWTGYYTSKPLLKLTHEVSTRDLLSAEIIGVVSGYDKTQVDLVKKGWSLLAPTTHHDFITGTALDSVYYSEQVPYADAYTLYGKKAIELALNKISSNLTLEGSTTQEKDVVVFNPLGFEAEGVTTIDVKGDYSSIITESGTKPIQKVGENKYLIKTDTLPSIGYKVYTLSHTRSVKDVPVLKISEDEIVMENEFVSAAIKKSKHYTITSLYDKVNNYEMFSNESSTILDYEDGGNIYRYGNEMGTNCKFEKRQMTFVSSSHEVTERGPLRITLKTSVTYKMGSAERTYIREYSLMAGESQLRVKVHGGAETRTSILTSFKFRETIGSVKYGTPYHHDDFLPIKYWHGLNFITVHNYLVLLNENNEIMGAMMQSAIRGWAVEKEEKTIYASLYRNTPRGCLFYGADAVDGGEYTYEYAIHTRNSLTKENALRKSLSFTSKPITNVIQNTGQKSSPYSLLRFEGVDGMLAPIITTVKHGSFDSKTVVVRFYAEVKEGFPLKSNLISSRNILSIKPITALEAPLDDDTVTVKLVSPKNVSITQIHAIGTVEIVFSS